MSLSFFSESFNIFSHPKMSNSRFLLSVRMSLNKKSFYLLTPVVKQNFVLSMDFKEALPFFKLKNIPSAYGQLQYCSFF
jgi:hypothetical protein